MLMMKGALVLFFSSHCFCVSDNYQPLQPIPNTEHPSSSSSSASFVRGASSNPQPRFCHAGQSPSIISSCVNPVQQIDSAVPHLYKSNVLMSAPCRREAALISISKLLKSGSFCEDKWAHEIIIIFTTSQKECVNVTAKHTRRLRCTQEDFEAP